MQRLGMFTGDIYREDATIQEECYQFISDEEASNEEFLRVERTRNSILCRDCCACPKAMKEH